jgi:hypothetical protein
MQSRSAALFLIVLTSMVAGLVLSQSPSAVFNVHLAPANATLSEKSLRILRDAYDDFATRLPSGESPIDVYVAQSYQEFRKLGAPSGRVEGFAASEAGVIVIKAPPLLAPGADYAAILRHELLHVLIARNTGVDNVPRWLNEGLAMMLSRENRFDSVYRVARMHMEHRVIDYGALSYVFSAPGEEEEFGDAYAQSLSMTKHLRNILGERGFWRFIGELREKDFATALRDMSGLSEQEFYDAWRGSLWKLTTVVSVLSGLGVFQVMALLLIAAYIRKRRRAQRVLADWKQEEDDEVDNRIFARQLEDQEGPYSWEEDDSEGDASQEDASQDDTRRF